VVGVCVTRIPLAGRNVQVATATLGLVRRHLVDAGGISKVLEVKLYAVLQLPGQASRG
jgi:hypothetical protein